MYGRQKNLHEVKELFTIKTDPNNTTVGEAVHTILEYVEFPKIVRSGQVCITYNRISQDKKSKKNSTTLSYLFDYHDFVRRKAFPKSLLMKQFLINGVTSIKIISIRGYECYKITLTNRDYLYDNINADKKDYIIDLFSEETDNEKKRKHIEKLLLEEAKV